MVNIIVAVGNFVPNKGFPIGKNGTMPWHNKADLKWFKDVTTGHPVIMGRKTYEAIGHPLKNRTNIIVSTRNNLLIENVDIKVYDTLEKAIDFAKSIDEEVFIIGGRTLYDYALSNDLVDRIYIDMLAENVPDADTFFPDVITDNEWEQVGDIAEIENYKAYATIYEKCRGKNNHVDEQYLNLINEIIKHGEVKDTRAGKTRSVFGRQLRFNLKEGLPMLTTKKMFAKGVIHELLWFLKGDTNIKYLVDNGVHIWDDDAYRYFLTNFKGGGDEFTIFKDKIFLERNEDGTIMRDDNGDYVSKRNRKLSKEEFIENVKNGVKWDYAGKHFPVLESYTFGDLGPVYGKQWRNFGSIDQIKEVIEKLRNNPDDRRIMISAWNVGEIKDMALPPCHYCCQFYTKKMTLEERKNWLFEKKGIEIYENIELLDEWDVPTRKLSCMWNQRSVDCGLGWGFNVLSYSILTHMVAQCCNMDVDELIFNGGDTHVYENHIESLKEQLSRNPHMYALPTLKLNSNITEIDDFTYEDIKIEGYKSYPTIKMPLSVGL